jgi:hypothetical protein
MKAMGKASRQKSFFYPPKKSLGPEIIMGSWKSSTAYSQHGEPLPKTTPERLRLIG